MIVSQPTLFRVLILEDSPEDAELCERELRKASLPVFVRRVANRAAYTTALHTFAPDLVISDYTLPQFNGAEAFEMLQSCRPESGFILVTGSLSEEIAVECLKQGMDDYLLKTSLVRLPAAVKNTLNKKASERERVRAEEALRESESRLSAIIESAMDAIMTVDAAQQIMLFNPAAEQLFGYPAEEVLGQPFEMLLKPLSLQSAAGQTSPHLPAAMTMGRRKSGAEFPVEASVSEATRTGETFYTVIVRDITDRLRAEAELKALNAELKTLNEDLECRVTERTGALVALNKEKDDILSIAAHDLRNPLTGILLAVQLYAQGATPVAPEKMMERMKLIGQAAERMNAIISDLLNAHTIETGTIALNLKPVALAELIYQTVAAFEDRATRKAISLQIEASNLTAIADSHAVSQILENLVGNALKFSPQGKRVWIRLRETDCAVRIEVQDEGQGLSADDIQKLFGKFQRLSARPTGGETSTGLGLSIVKRLVEAMRGRVWAESEPDQGATFTVELEKNLTV